MPSKGWYYLPIYIDDTFQNIPHTHYHMIMKLINDFSIKIAPPGSCGAAALSHRQHHGSC